MPHDVDLDSEVWLLVAFQVERDPVALLRVLNRDVQYGAALALALAGDAFRAQALAEDLAKRLPEDTVVQFNYLPTLRAQLALNRSDSSKAIEALQGATSYELRKPGNAAFTPALYCKSRLRGSLWQPLTVASLRE